MNRKSSVASWSICWRRRRIEKLCARQQHGVIEDNDCCALDALNALAARAHRYLVNSAIRQHAIHLAVPKALKALTPPDRTGLLELSESSERSSPPLSGDQDDVRTWKPLGSSQRSERPGLFERSDLLERSQQSGHSSPPLSGEQRDVRTWKPFGMD